MLFNPPPCCGSSSEELQAPHVGLAYLTAVLEQRGFKVWVIDAHPFSDEWQALLSIVLRIVRPDVVGITSTTSTIYQAYRAARLAKQIRPESFVVMGGPHVTFLDKETLSECNEVDIVVRGEGEQTFIELLERLEAGRPLNGTLGLTYRETDGSVRREPDRPLIENLDSLPFPSYRQLPLDLYRSFGTKPPSLPVVTSRGCPFRCSFCISWKLNRGKWRTRDPSRVVDELEHHIYTYKISDFSFVDDIFTLSRKRVKEICREIRRRKLKVTWGCSARVDSVDPLLLLEMKKAGCHTIYFGVESKSSRTLKEMGKGLTVEKIVEAFKLCRRLGINTIASVMLFWPTETRRDVEETVKFVKQLESDIAQFCITTPFPGTFLYEELKRSRLLVEEDWSKYDIVTPVFETKEFNRKYMLLKWKQAYITFYLRPNYIAKQLIKRSIPLFKALGHVLKQVLVRKLRLPDLEVSLRRRALPFFLKCLLRGGS
ncbi:MAG: B12-binding domain-containing radical SAM protein [Candidatus Nezhaarchaeota archaeon]|nr:B12-binding domain-containing radical SAM protein [Candidatus Nezhaarchaeota archaeon]